jgi:predicted ATPase
MKRIVSPTDQERELLKATLEEKTHKLKKLAQENKIFQEYALSSELDVEPLIRTIGRATTSYKRRTLSNVLTAYLEGLETWLSGLRSIYNTVDGFVKCLNGFLDPKIVRFRVDEGLTLCAPNGQVLRPDMLSSGERHLLLILCCTVILSDQMAVFIVDEPEISLNVTWQRKLLKALLTLSANSNMQFLMASHSIQVTARYSKHVMELSPTAGKER